MLATIIKGDYEDILNKISWVDENDQDFIISIRYLVEKNNVELLQIIFDSKSVMKFGDKKVVSLAAESSVEVFELFEALFDHEYHFETHPLISACSTGNTKVVKIIIDHIRNGRLNTNDPKKLKELAIKIAARKGLISVLMLLCKTHEHVHNAISGLISNGNHKQIPRMLSHPELDFSTNDFELLKLCSLYVVELIEISRHKSVYENYDKLPADYYRKAVDAAKKKFIKSNKLMRDQHTKKVKETANGIFTGAANRTIYLSDIPAGTQEPTFTPVRDEWPEEHPLHEITQRYHRSAMTNEDIKTMVTGVHMHHRHDFERQIRDQKLEKFVL
jgi:hypothetical protein